MSRNDDVALQVAALILRVLPPTRATNFHAAEENRGRFYFLQHENLLRVKIAISATSGLQFATQHCFAKKLRDFVARITLSLVWMIRRHLVATFVRFFHPRQLIILKYKCTRFVNTAVDGAELVQFSAIHRQCVKHCLKRTSLHEYSSTGKLMHALRTFLTIARR